MAWNMLLNVFSIFILFLFVYFVMYELYSVHRKNSFLKIEQREGVPKTISFFTRILNTYLLVLVYQLPLIIIWNVVFQTSLMVNDFEYSGVISLINYQPLITLFIICIISLIINFLNEVFALLLTVLISIVYSISPMVSLFIADSKNTLTTHNNIVNNFLPNMVLGKTYYDYVSENDVNGGNITITKPSDLYVTYVGNSIYNLFSFGDVYNIMSADDKLNSYEQWSFFKNFIEPVFNLSSFIKNENQYQDFFDSTNSVFSENMSLSYYHKYLDVLLSNKDVHSNNKLGKLISFMDENIDSLINVYELTMPNYNGYDGDFNNFSIALGIYRDCSESSTNKNYMLDTLIWEMLTFYNLSLSPIMLNRNDISDYQDIKNYESDSYNGFDSFMVFNHLYLMTNYNSIDRSLKEIKYNTYTKNPITSKCIAKPYKITFSNDDVLKDLINNKTCDPSNPYSKKVTYKVSKNINISLMRCVYPMISIFIIVGSYFIFKYKMLN